MISDGRQIAERFPVGGNGEAQDSAGNGVRD